MKRVVRIIIYEGDNEWVDKTLEKSLKEGYTNIDGGSRTIKVVNLETVLDCFDDMIPSQNDTNKKDSLCI